MAFPDLDVSHPSAEEVRAFTDATTALEATANTVRTQRDEIQRGASGNAINVQTSVLTDIEQKIRDAATKTAKVAAAMKVLREAGDTWLKVAPKKAEIEAAEKEVETAREVMAMAERMGVPSGPPAEKFEAAKKKLREMLEKRKSADEAYSAACKSAREKVGGVDADRSGGDPGGSVTGSSKPAPSGASVAKAETGTVASAGTSSPAPSAASTPAGTRATGTSSPSAKPVSGTTSSSASKPDTDTATAGTPALDALLARQLAGQQRQSAASPLAGLPVQQAQSTAQTQPGKDKAQEGAQGAGGPITSTDLAALLGPGFDRPMNSGNMPGATPSQPQTSPSATPASTGGGTRFREGFEAPGAGNTPVKPLQSGVTGTSVTGVQTGADVSGRSIPTPGAFAAPGASTSTSGAHGGGPGEQTPASSRPAGPGGTPMGGMPLGGMPMGGGGGGGRSSKSPEDRGVLAENPLLDGSAAIEEAVKHGTIIRKDDV